MQKKKKDDNKSKKEKNNLHHTDGSWNITKYKKKERER